VSSLKTKSALERLGLDIRGARLRRGMAVSDLAARAGASPSTVTRLERGEAGVAVGTLVDVLVVLGLADKLGDLFDVRNDNLGLALTEERLPRRGRTFATIVRRQMAASRKQAAQSVSSEAGQDKSKAASVVDPDGVGF
jgi:transcriptional regulator with XRE-family HTH domain